MTTSELINEYNKIMPLMPLVFYKAHDIGKFEHIGTSFVRWNEKRFFDVSERFDGETIVKVTDRKTQAKRIYHNPKQSLIEALRSMNQ